MSARVEAAAKVVLIEISDWYPLEGVPNLGAHAMNLANEAVSAADSVLFSEAAIERAAEALYAESPLALYDEGNEQFVDGGRPWEWLTDEYKASMRGQARAVVAALREEA